MKFLRKPLILIFWLTVALLFGCAPDNLSEPTPTVTAPTEEYVAAAKELTITVSQSVAATVEPLLGLYEALEGVTVSMEIYDIANLSDTSGLIISDSIHPINGLAALGNVVAVEELSSPLLASLADSVPDYLYSADNVPFLPVGIDGYAYLCNTELLGDILSIDDKTQLADNLRKASANQWDTATQQLFSLIGGLGEEEILRFSAAEYNLPEQLPEEIENLIAPYALNLADPISLTAPLAVILNGIQLDSAAEEALVSGYVEFILSEMQMMATPEGLLEVGGDVTELSIENAAALYEQDKVLFLRASLSDAYRYLSEDALANTVIFPLKLPVEGMSDTTDAYTLSSAITVTTPFVFAVGSGDDENQYNAAMDFLVWFYYSQTGKSYITDTLGLLEINHSTAKNPLSVQLADYIENDSVIPDRLLFTSPDSIKRVQTIFYTNYVNITEWTPELIEQLTAEIMEII